jgi:hypothetical protein
MSIAEILLIIGTFGICTGVWTTLAVILRQNAKPRVTNNPNITYVKPSK